MSKPWIGYYRKGRPLAVIVTTNGMVYVEGRNYLTDWPLLCEDGTILYDYPWSVPSYVKAMVRHAFRDLGYHVITPPKGHINA